MSEYTFPLIAEIICPDPQTLFANLPFNGAIFLDSARKGDAQGRYSFIALDPFQMFICKNGHVQIGTQKYEGNPFDLLAQELHQYSLPTIADLPPFQGGAAGILGYELGRYLEKLPEGQKDDLDFPELLMGFYDVVIGWDHHLAKVWVFSCGFPEQEPVLRMTRARQRLNWVLELVSTVLPHNTTSFQIAKEKIHSTFEAQSYELAVEKVIEYIRAGDIFEANISQRFSTFLPSELAPFDLYCKLRHYNPAPFAAFMQYGNYALASASPERFLLLQKDKVQARPIKGTRPRHSSPEKDAALARELLNSEKDRAENVMIVDLMRNDLSRVCQPHTIGVPQLCGLESFATVHHLVSVVEGTLMPGENAVSLLKATFPGGSITGAPKIRAMEIIAEIEPTVRGPYCGSVGYIGFNGDMDLSITIRTFALNKNFVTFQTGGAITIDSDPHEEYEETLTKARALRKTLVES